MFIALIKKDVIWATREIKSHYVQEENLNIYIYIYIIHMACVV